jgi:hypothetical protein
LIITTVQDEDTPVEEILLASNDISKSIAGMQICTPCGTSTYLEQSFKPSTNAKLSSIVVNLLAMTYSGIPKSDFHITIYAHTGTYGTNSKPTGSVLATSDAASATLISDTDYTRIKVTFSGVNKIDLSEGTPYCWVIQYPDNDGSLMVGTYNGSPSLDGNLGLSADLLNWTTYSTYDCVFEIYGT